MAEEAVVLVKKVVVEEKVSSKTGKPYKSMIVTDESGTEFNGFVNKDTMVPEKDQMVKILFQPVNLKSGQAFNIQKIEEADVATKSTTTKLSVKDTSTKTENLVTKTMKDRSIESQAILKSLLESGQYHSQDVKYLNLNTIALKKHAKEVLEILDELVAESVG